MMSYRIIRAFFAAAFLAVPALTGLSCCCLTDPCDDCHNGDRDARASFRYAAAAEGITVFSLEGINGDVEITGTPSADSVIVRGERSVRSDSEEDAREHLALLSVEFGPSAGAVTVRTRQPNRNEGRTYTVNYHVLLPERVLASVIGVNGNAEVIGMTAPVSVVWTNGDLFCADLHGGCEASLVNGRLVCDGTLPVSGSIVLSGVNGNVFLTVPDTTSALIDARTTNGAVTVSGLSVRDLSSSRTAVSGVIGTGRGTIRLTTVNGNVALAGE
ncbi:DUF4097 family beta strand repeat protein [bacterium]|nr:DUF4097 family beta strand repeat protein [bacterium]